MGTETSILIVDDNLKFRQTLSDILRAQGYVPIGASTGKAALDRIEEEGPGVALIDLRLRDMSGLEVMRGIKERSPGTECIVLTGYTSQASAIEAVNLGAYGYVQKPYDMEQLLLTIRRAVEKREAEEALRESEEKYRTLVEGAGEAIFKMRQDGVFLFINSVAAQRLGGQPKDFIGKTMWDAFPQEVADRQVAHVSEVIRSEQGCITETVTILQSEPHWYRTSIQPIKDRSAKTDAVLVVATDITERKQAEEEIRQRTAQLEVLRQVGLELAAQLDLDALLRSITSQAIELVRGNAGGFYLYQPDRDVLEWIVSIGSTVAPVGTILQRGEGLSGKVLETGKPIVVDDYWHWEGRSNAWEGYVFAAIVGVPVRWGGEFLGVLNVVSDTPRAFSQGDADLLALLATQAAIAIRNARLYEQAQARSHYLETLQRINATLRSTLPLSQVLETITQCAGEALGYVGSTIAIPDATGERLIPGSVWGGAFLDTVLSFTGVELDTFGLLLAERENPIAQAYLSKELQVLSGEPERIAIGMEPPVGPELAPLIERGMGAKLAVCVPLPVGDRVVGVLGVFSPRAQLLDEERAMLLGLADQAGLAIENARLYEETHSRAERLAVVNRIARAAGAILHLDDLMETVYQEITSVFQSDAFFIALYDEGGHELDFRIRVDKGMREPREQRPLRTGLTALVISEKRPVLVRDFETEKDQLPEASLWGTMKAPSSWLGVPMLIGERVIGAISVQAYQRHAYGEEEELLLSTIADQVAVAIENARLYEETRRRALEQEMVSRIAYTLNTLDVRDAFPVLIESLRELTGCDMASLLLMDEASDQFIVADLTSPFPVLKEGSSISLSDTAAMECLEVGRPYLIADLSTETHFLLERSFYQAGLRSLATLPLFTGGEIFGALILGGDHTNLFRESQLPVLQQITDAVSLAVENSLLFQAERRQRELAEALEEAAAAVSSTLEPDQVLDRILEQVERVVAGDAFNIMLIEKGTARVVRWRGYERLGMEGKIAHFIAPVVELPSLVQMVQTRKPVVIPDTSTDPDWVLLEGWKWAHSYVGALIRVEDVTVGILNVEGTHPGQFGPADADRLEAFAGYAAAAIKNARLFEQAQQEIAERKWAEEELQRSLEQLRRTFEGAVDVLESTIEIRDPYTAGHQRQVSKLASAIASEMGLPEERVEGIRVAGMIHDIGKISVPAQILSKPGGLNGLEYSLIKEHVKIGYELLNTIDFPWAVAQIVLQHHERMDGSGYPGGLSGDEIMLEAKILAVADVVVAMSSHRPYRSAFSMDKALEEILQNKAVLYDTEVVDICLKLFTENGLQLEQR